MCDTVEHRRMLVAIREIKNSLSYKANDPKM